VLVQNVLCASSAPLSNHNYKAGLYAFSAPSIRTPYAFNPPGRPNRPRGFARVASQTASQSPKG
jgi:hypothetical protein